MDRYTYRGKRLKNGEWIYGNIQKADGMMFISVFGERVPIAVDPKTVGQCTGLMDKNNHHIFEGDIDEFGGVCGYVEDEAAFMLMYFDEDTKEFLRHASECLGEIDLSKYQIVGNIHDNPEIIS